MKKWEYKVISTRQTSGGQGTVADQLEGVLNVLGKNGWRVVPVVPAAGGDCYCLMEREVLDSKDETTKIQD